MEKVYLLLRDNVESGPFTLFELLQMQLKPTDMIWMEGQSTAWTYLSEMELKIPSVEKNKPDPSVNTRQRRYVDEIEQKAEEIRRRALSYKPDQVRYHKEPVRWQQEPTGVYMLPDEEIELIDHRQEKKRNMHEVVVTGVIICLFAGGLYAGATYLQTRKEIISPAAIRVKPPEKTVQVKKVLPATTPGQEFIFPEDEKNDSAQVQEETAFYIPAKKQEPHQEDRDSLSLKTEPAPVLRPIADQPQVTEPAAKKITELKEEKKEPEKAQTVQPKSEDKKEPEKKDSVKRKVKTEEAKDEDEKKGLGKTLKNLFRKKDKKKDKDDQ